VARKGWRGVGRKTAGHPSIHQLTRAGLAARGLVYLLIGWLAVQTLLGRRRQEADQSGVLQAVLSGPGGILTVWMMAAGFAGLVIWQVAEARYGRPVPQGHRVHNRAFAVGRALIYTLGLAGTVSFAVGFGGGTEQSSRDATANALAQPGGRWLVLAVGAGFVVCGLVVCWQALHRAFLDELDTANMSTLARHVVIPLGMVGNCARGLVLGAVGVFLAYSAIAFDPNLARGLDGTLRQFALTPAGPWLMGAVAAGLAVFGVYAFCESRWRKVDPT
jgi:hypothetical protein